MQKKLRKIVVRGMTFQWSASWSYEHGCRIIRLRIWGDGKSRCPLYVHLASKWVEYPTYSAYPKPKDVMAIIDFALAHGWKPQTQGAPYWLMEDDHLMLNDLLLTNVGHIPGAASPLSRQCVPSPYNRAFQTSSSSPDKQE